MLYPAVSEVAISAVLVWEEKGTQSPTYYISKILSRAETRYPYLAKLALALVVAARKLRPYFQCHPIAVVTTFPLRNILHKPELSGRFAKWAVQMSEVDIEYKPRTAIKSKVLADFDSPGLQRGNNGVRADIGSLDLIYGWSFKCERVRARNSLGHIFWGNLKASR